MRSRLVAAVLLPVLLLSAGFCCRRAVDARCRRMEALVQTALTASFPAAPLSRAGALWEESLPLLSTLLHHQPLEQVGSGLARARGYLAADDRAGFLAELHRLLYLLEDIRTYDDLTLQNLF